VTTYRLFPSTNGPGNTSYSGPFLAGVLFGVTQGGMWLDSYYFWVPASGDVVSRKFALWNVTGNNAATLIPAASVAASGTLTANSWNQVPLPAPVPLALGTVYNACTGWTVSAGFPDSNTSTDPGNCYGTGGHTAGITNGPLFAFSDQGGSKGEPYGNPQGVFSAALGTDPTVHAPFAGSNSGNFWVDVLVDTTGPGAYTGPYRLWPNKVDANSVTVQDAAVNYDVATEFALSQPCSLSKVWYYSPPGTAQLATAANVWNITGGGLSGTLAATNASPSWSGAAGSGWVSCPISGTLGAGKYKVSVYNSAGTPDGWSAKDANSDYWRNGAAASGITWGPLSAPNLASTSLAYNFNGNAGGTPPYSDGTTAAAQPTFTQGPPDSYPYLFAAVASPAAGSTQNYWVDVELSLAAGVAVAAPQLAVTRTEVIGGGRGGVGRAVRI
jgi:hypothetical protein